MRLAMAMVKSNSRWRRSCSVGWEADVEEDGEGLASGRSAPDSAPVVLSLSISEVTHR